MLGDRLDDLMNGRRAAAPLLSQRLAFAGLLAFCLTIPSNWTQDIPARYGARHPGLEHSRLYPHIDTAPPSAHHRNAAAEPGREPGGTASRP